MYRACWWREVRNRDSSETWVLSWHADFPWTLHQIDTTAWPPPKQTRDPRRHLVTVGLKTVPYRPSLKLFRGGAKSFTRKLCRTLIYYGVLFSTSWQPCIWMSLSVQTYKSRQRKPMRFLTLFPADLKWHFSFSSTPLATGEHSSLT